MLLKEGVMYSLFKDDEIAWKELNVSIKSLKKTNPNVNTCLMTSIQNVPSFISSKVDQVIKVNEQLHFNKMKCWVYPLTPYERTLYLGFDTKITKDISEVFEFLKIYDIAAAHEPQFTWPLDDEKVNYFHDQNYFNADVIGYRMNDKVKAFLDLWMKSFIDQDDALFQSKTKRWDDQDWFNKLLNDDKVGDELGLKILVLPSTVYNARPWIWSKLKKDNIKQRTKIFHAHNQASPGLPSVISKVNYKISQVIRSKPLEKK